MTRCIPVNGLGVLAQPLLIDTGAAGNDLLRHTRAPLPGRILT